MKFHPKATILSIQFLVWENAFRAFRSGSPQVTVTLDMVHLPGGTLHVLLCIVSTNSNITQVSE